MNHSMLKEALHYRDRGFSVIPLSYKGKKPLIPWEEYQERIAQKGEVQEWWSKWPDANIGIVTGEVSGLVVVDVDGEKGLETAKRLGLPKGPTVKTGNGYHRYFRHPGNGDVRNFQARADLHGIDLRGDGGYVVAPPSIHPSDEPYKWVIPLNTASLTPFPEAILGISPAKSPLTNLLKGVPEGERNNALARLTGKLLQEEWSLGEVLQFALTWNHKNSPPLAEREVQRTIASIHKAHLKNGQGVPFSFNPIGGAVKTELTRVNADTLQQRSLDPDRPPLQFLPLLGRDRFLVKGFSHTVASYPKTGKTTLMSHQALKWSQSGEKILYITEESEYLWEHRLATLPKGWQNMNLVFAMGNRRDSIYQVISSGEENIIVIDTVRLWGIEDENDNAKIGLALSPLVGACQVQGKTLILISHTRKQEGQHGQAIAGGHAFLGIVDIGLEIARDSHAPTRRLIKGWGRIEVPELLYELREGELVALGEPGEVELETVKERLGEVLTDDWQKTQELTEAIGSPKPSTPQAIKALESLARAGIAERNPSLEVGHKQGGKGYQWRRASKIV